LIKAHKRQRRERGQTLIFVLLAMPLFLALIALVVDGSMLLVKKRALQNAADAAALAVVQSAPDAGCGSGCLASFATDYSQKNGGPDLHACNDPDPTNPTDSNCFRYPYVDKDGHIYDGNHFYDGKLYPQEAEVRMTVSSPTIFAGAIGLGSHFKVSASSVAQNLFKLAVSTVTGPDTPGSTSVQIIPGGTHTTTDPDQLSGGSGVAFAMSRVCGAIQYTGAGTKGNDVIGALATNGGLDFGGLGNGSAKKVTWLAFDQARCMNAPNHDPDSPPSGTSACTAIAWGNPTNSSNACVQTLAPLHNPINWPITPPTPPTPLGPGVQFNPATDYPSRCADPGATVGNNWASTHPPGIYCVSGTGTNLQFSSNGVNLTGGDGYTFFALNGATITASGNTLAAKFYWPSSPPTANCSIPRPDTTRPASYVCFGRTISNYDAETLFYATYPSADGVCAICLQGQGDNLTGDIFATKPDLPFPPSLTQTGGLITVGGGALAAGQGFIESWNLKIAGNTGSYRGTGASIVIPGATHTTTDPTQTQTIIIPGQPGQVTTVATTIGTDIDLSQ
jgi:putative Flp pilus-assembly TadE/G-like protein